MKICSLVNTAIITLVNNQSAISSKNSRHVLYKETITVFFVRIFLKTQIHCVGKKCDFLGYSR
jgi:hypothetical protein